MNHHQRRFLSQDILSKVPPGVNPFQYLIDLAAPALSYSLSTTTTRYILWVFFVLHWLIVLFCLVVLGLLYQRGVQQFLWLVRRLDIEDKNGKNVPLFLVNTNVLIPITQCMGSLASQGYILLVIKNVTSSRDRTTHTMLSTMMLVMFTCEIMTYWFLSHCFLVAIYSSYRNRNHVSKGPRKWMPSPILINAVFLIFPIGVLAASITVFTRLTLVLNPFIDEVVTVMNVLREGSSIWEQLGIPSISMEEKSELVTNLTQVVARAESLGQTFEIHFQDILNWFITFQWVMLTLICIAALVFVLVFCKLAQRFHEQAHHSSTSSVSQSSPIQLQSWNSQEAPSNIIEQRSHHTNRTFIDTVRSNPQFLHLIVRALCIVVAILTAMSNLVLGIVANEQALTNPKILRVLVWLVTASGTWSAIPISWHCWRLYKDKSGGTLLTSSASSMKSKEVALTVYRSSVPPEQSFERVIDEIKVKQGFQTRSTLNFSKALEDLSSARYSHGEYCLNNFAS